MKCNEFARERLWSDISTFDWKSYDYLKGCPCSGPDKKPGRCKYEICALNYTFYVTLLFIDEGNIWRAPELT